MDVLHPEDMEGGAEELFDVLDADSSGTLTVAEIVDGVMRVQFCFLAKAHLYFREFLNFSKMQQHLREFSEIH